MKRHMKTWKIMEAKIQLSKIVKFSEIDGPQVITVRGEPKVVLLSFSDYEKLAKISSKNVKQTSNE